MNTKAAKDTIEVIRKERQRRRAELPDPEDAAYDQWMFTDEPFINDLCLVLLVAIRHQVERELVGIAARVTDDGAPLDRKQYQERMRDEREGLRHGWKPLIGKLDLRSFPEWQGSMQTLRLLVNSYKHSPWGRPDEDLLQHLKLPLTRNYAVLPDSRSVREKLADSLGLDKDADYCEITEELLNRADSFLGSVRQRPGLSEVKWGRLSLAAADAEC
jgi:hypothetical protein